MAGHDEPFQNALFHRLFFESDSEDEVTFVAAIESRSTGSTPATRLEILQIRCSIAPNDLCTFETKRRPIPGGVFIYTTVTVRRHQQVGDCDG
jgi:hypothetical protein